MSGRSFALVALAAGALALCAARAGASPCALEEAAPVEIAALDDAELDPLTRDGRRLVLSGVEFPSDAAMRETARAYLARRLAPGRVAFLALAERAPDRWGRLPAGLFVEGEGNEEPLVSLAEALLREGLARFRPDPAAIACRNGLLTAEQKARSGELGLWASGEYHMLDAGRPETLLRRKGLVIVEGVVDSIGEAGGSLYLNFGPRRWRDFAVVIWKRNQEIFERAGVRPRMLAGRRVRVRGLIDTGFGPRMEIFSPAQIELLGDSAAR